MDRGTKAKWKQACQGICGRWLRKGRPIYNVFGMWVCRDCATQLEASDEEDRGLRARRNLV